MDQADAPAARHHDGDVGQPQAAEAVVVAAHRDHRRDGLQVLEHRRHAQVAGVQHQVAAVERLEHARRQRVEVLADVAVGDDADPPGAGGAAHPA